MFLACLFLKLILYWIQKTMFACSFLNWNQTQNKTLPRRELRENLGWGLVTYSYSLNVWRKIKGKKQHWTCRWEKMSKAVEENKLTVMIRRFYENSIYIVNLCTQTKIMIRAKRAYPHPLQPLPLQIQFS